MKKIFLLTAACMITVAAFSQQKAVKYDQTVKSVVRTANFNDKMKGDENLPALPVNPSRSTKTANIATNEMEVGHTMYDLQSNSGLSNRFVHFNDGTMGATWTGGVESAPSFPDRGSFYNYFNGTEFSIDPSNAARIESKRSGWPSYSGDGKGGEYIVSHSPVALYHRDVKGTGTWNEIANPIDATGATWPRLCVNPATNTIHVLECVQAQVGTQYENTIYYSRSKDGGKTWDPQGGTFTELTSHYSKIAYSADSYIWATPRNGVIAFALLSETADAIIMKSTDDGNTWERIVAWEHPIPMFNYYTMTEPDTCMSPNGTGALIIDENGMCHLFFGVCNVKFTDAMDGSYNYWPLWGNMMYWNEDMDAYQGYDGMRASSDYETFAAQLVCEVPIAGGFCFNGDASPVNGGGLDVCSHYRTLGPVSFVSAELAGPNRIIVAATTWDERRSTPQNFIIRQVFLCSYTYNEDEERWRLDENWKVDSNMSGYICGFTQGGEGIAYPYNGWFRMNNDFLHEYDECIYPQVVCQYSNDDRANFYVYYSFDVQAELMLDTDTHQTEYTDNTIMMYYNNRLFTGATLPEVNWDGISDVKPENNMMKVYPNPVSGTLNISLNENANVTIYNLLGETVATFKGNSGIEHFNVSSLAQGVYFVIANNGSKTETQKFVVK